MEKNQVGRCWGWGLTPRAGDQGRVWNEISGEEETALGNISLTLTVARPDVIMLQHLMKDKGRKIGNWRVPIATKVCMTPNPLFLINLHLHCCQIYHK